MSRKLCRSLGTTASPCKHAGETIYSPADFTPYVQCHHPDNLDNKKYKLNLESLQDAETNGLDMNECELYEKGEEIVAEVPESLKKLKKKNYMLITGTKEDVERIVNNKIEEGYVVCGGAFITGLLLDVGKSGLAHPQNKVSEFAQSVCASVIRR